MKLNQLVLIRYLLRQDWPLEAKLTFQEKETVSVGVLDDSLSIISIEIHLHSTFDEIVFL
jgi:hypothetical protein